MRFQITEAILKFEMIREIGHEGRNSKVYLAKDPQLQTILVIKKMAKDRFESTQDFFKESERLFRSSHNNVVEIKYACQTDDSIYLAMPYYRNGSMKALIDKQYLTIREIIRYATQFLSGLHNIHLKGLVHFDVKPDNILLSDNNEALISDFGQAADMDPFGLSEQHALYNLHLPPDVFTHSKHGIEYDIYCIGLTLYRMCNGNNHFYDQLADFQTDVQFSRAIEKGLFPDRKKYLPHIPKPLQKIINKALDINPEKRQRSALSVMNELASVKGLLDWRYDISHDNSKWSMPKNNKTIEVILTGDGIDFAVNTYKADLTGGNKRKHHAACAKNISASNINTTIQSILNRL